MVNLRNECYTTPVYFHNNLENRIIAVNPMTGLLLCIQADTLFVFSKLQGIIMATVTGGQIISF